MHEKCAGGIFNLDQKFKRPFLITTVRTVESQPNLFWLGALLYTLRLGALLHTLRLRALVLLLWLGALLYIQSKVFQMFYRYFLVKRYLVQLHIADLYKFFQKKIEGFFECFTVNGLLWIGWGCVTKKVGCIVNIPTQKSINNNKDFNEDWRKNVGVQIFYWFTQAHPISQKTLQKIF